MSITTSQQISKWYDLYRAIDVTFSKEIVKATGFSPRNVALKCVGEQWPCVIYSTSFSGAKIIISVKPPLIEKLKQAGNLVSLRFGFITDEKQELVTFFVNGKVNGFAPFNGQGVPASGDYQYVTIEYTQRPPDDLIEIIGKLLEASMNSTRRRDDRILLTPESMRRIGLASKNTMLFVQGVPRKCILRDLSFYGAKLIIVGIARFLLKKECILSIEMDDPREVYSLKGVIVRCEDVEGRKDLAAIAIHFSEADVPLSFKMHINGYFEQARESQTELVSMTTADGSVPVGSALPQPKPTLNLPGITPAGGSGTAAGGAAPAAAGTAAAAQAGTPAAPQTAGR